MFGIHREDEDKVLTNIDLKFLGTSDLSKHSHTKHKMWNCKTCGKDFPTKCERLRHRMKEHSDELEACGIPTGKKGPGMPILPQNVQKTNWPF